MSGVGRVSAGAVLGVLTLLLAGCGGSDSPAAPDPDPASPAPSVSSMSPTSVEAGYPAFTLTVDGNGFVAASVVRWNGQPRPTTRVSATRLTAQIGAADVAAPGTAQVSVFTPPPGGGTSQQVPFTIEIVEPDPPLPVLQSLDPSHAPAGSEALTLRVLGSDFVPVSVVHWNGEPRSTAFESPGELVASVSAADLATADTAWVTVVTPGPGGGTSGPLPFVVDAMGGDWEVALGREHGCALDPDGAAWCWGRGTGGRLGNGSTQDHSVPVPVSGGHRFASIVAGEHHSCALTPDGEAWCWGDGVNGRLGDGTGVTRLTPVPVEGGHRFSTLAAGNSHTCGINLEGETWCWGSNGFGMLGQGTQGGWSLVPVRVTGGVLPISLHSYAEALLTCVLDAEGRIWCWGRNPAGTDPFSLVTPTLVSDTPAMVALTVSSYWLCGLEVSGAAWCMGNGNGWGELGRGVVGGTAPFNLAPVVGGRSFDRITSGWAHACALTLEGDAWCWGDSRWGRLGNGGGGDDPVPAPTPVTGGLQFRTLSAGEFHTCGATLDGEVWCWGRNTRGQLGNGGTTDALEPVRVQFP